MTDSIDAPVGDFDWGPKRRPALRFLPWLTIACGLLLLVTGLALAGVH